MDFSEQKVQDYLRELCSDADEIEEIAERFFSSLDTERDQVSAGWMSDKRGPRLSGWILMGLCEILKEN
ncbi:hypothetical protein ACODNH_01635 (plasmid) [Haloarcula sp. NS06]|uniref:hypothetical protein n=1 Tax=Haloarcula sp. NS06 TaxID=3409688 RepID=UPI003DA6D1F9